MTHHAAAVLPAHCTRSLRRQLAWSLVLAAAVCAPKLTVSYPADLSSSLLRTLNSAFTTCSVGRGLTPLQQRPKMPMKTCTCHVSPAEGLQPALMALYAYACQLRAASGQWLRDGAGPHASAGGQWGADGPAGVGMLSGRQALSARLNEGSRRHSSAAQTGCCGWGHVGAPLDPVMLRPFLPARRAPQET